MTFNQIGSFTLGQVNPGLSLGVGLMNPMVAQLDLFLTGPSGAGALMADVQAQFTAALGAVGQLSLNLSNPLTAIQSIIMSFANIQAALASALTFGFPTVALQITQQVAAMAALTGTLSAKLGGIKGLVKAGGAVKAPALNFISEMNGALSAGPVAVAAFSAEPLANVAAQIAAGMGGINPGAPVYGVVLLTQDPAVYAALGTILKVA